MDSNAPTTHTRLAQAHGPSGHTRADGRAGPELAAIGAVVAGGLGVVSGLVPGLGIVAIGLALVAGILGVLGRRGAPGRHRLTATIGLVLAAGALALGVLNVMIQLDLFSYFTAEG